MTSDELFEIMKDLSPEARASVEKKIEDLYRRQVIKLVKKPDESKQPNADLREK